MPQDEKTTGNAKGISYSTANIDSLLNSFDAGDIITKSAVDTLLDYYADIRDHDHGITDIAVKDNFGNTDGDQSSSASEDVDTASLNATPADPGTNSTITASKHNAIRNAVNSLRGHVHNWNDNTG